MELMKNDISCYKLLEIVINCYKVQLDWSESEAHGQCQVSGWILDHSRSQWLKLGGHG